MNKFIKFSGFFSQLDLYIEPRVYTLDEQITKKSVNLLGTKKNKKTNNICQEFTNVQIHKNYRVFFNVLFLFFHVKGFSFQCLIYCLCYTV